MSLLTIEETKHFSHLAHIPSGYISIKTLSIAECLVQIRDSARIPI